jgi:hypothetical protein
MIVSMTQDQLRALLVDAVRDALAGKLDLSKVVSASSDAKPAKAKRAKKERDPDAPKKEPNDWIKFTSRVRSVLSGQVEDGKKLHPKAVTQTASKLKDASLMATASDEQIIAAYRDWLANPPAVSKMVAEGRDKKSKKSKSSDGSSSAPSTVVADAPSADAKPKKERKPRAKMTDEQKAAKKAAKAAKAAKTEAPKAAAVVEPSSDGDLADFEPFTWMKMSLLKNSRGDVLTEDMEWFGKWDAAKNKVDTSAPQPDDLEL